MSSKRENKFEIEDGETRFLDLFKRYYEPLTYFAYKYVRDEQTSEDIVQDVFVYLWNDRERLHFSFNIGVYLYKAVRNRALKQIRRKSVTEKYKPLDISLDLEETPETIMMNNELAASIAVAIEELPDKRREIFCMNRFDQLTYIEIATILNISLKTVETQMSRSLKYLRKRLSFLLKTMVL